MNGEYPNSPAPPTTETVAQHTPGPWTIAGRETALKVVEARRSWMRVCFLTSDGPCEANARLIAAAPDLLEALKELTNSCDAIPGCPVTTRARMAIHKAEGRS